jgi:hypothetical protein
LETSTKSWDDAAKGIPCHLIRSTSTAPTKSDANPSQNLSALPALEELKKLGDEVFHDLDDPWRDEFFKFIEEHKDATIYHAIASDGVHMLYCPDKDRGIWFLAGGGKAILSPTGRQMMKEAVGGRS